MKILLFFIVILSNLACAQESNLVPERTYFDRAQSLLKSEGKIDKTTQKKEGVWKFYNREGELVYTGSYKDDQKTGTWEYFDPFREKGEMLNGKKEGIWKTYRNDGTLSSKAFYVNGLKEGKSESYFPNGSLLTQTNYVGNMLNGPQITYKKGGDTSLYVTYVNDKRNGLFKNYSSGLPYVIGNWKEGIGFVGEVYHYRNKKLVEVEFKDENGKTVFRESKY